MALARLTKQYRECPFVETCNHKEIVTMYKDELEKILYKDLYSHLGLQFGG